MMALMASLTASEPEIPDPRPLAMHPDVPPPETLNLGL